MASFTPPSANPSQALVIPGFPFVQVAGSGKLGNDAANENIAREQSSSAQSAALLKSQGQGSHTPADRII